MKVKRRLFQLLVVILFLLPLLLYTLYFHDYDISRNPVDWGVFGDYVGGVYSIFVAILVVLITRSLNKKDERQKKKSQCAEVLYLQIVKVKRNLNQNSITKFVSDINDSELYLPPSLIKQLKQLHDSYQSKHDATGLIDLKIEKEVLEILKDIYDE